MIETRLSDALLLESTTPWWILIIVAMGALIMIPGILHYFGLRLGEVRGHPLAFVLAGGFFVLLPLMFLFAHEDLTVEINRPSGAITIRDPSSRVELPIAAFHSLYIAEVREEKGLDYRLYLRRPGGRNFYIDEFDTAEQALRMADPISALVGLPIQRSDDENGAFPVFAATASPTRATPQRLEISDSPMMAPSTQPAEPRATATTTSENVSLQKLQTEHGAVYSWELRQYWMILPGVAWAGILYLLFFVLPARRGWTPILILFQFVFSLFFLALLLALPLGLLGKQNVLPGKNTLLAWQDVGGFRIRESSIRYDQIELFQHVMNDTGDPFLTLMAGKDLRYRMIQLDLRGLSVAEQKQIEDAVFEHLPPAQQAAAIDLETMTRKKQTTIFQQF